MECVICKTGTTKQGKVTVTVDIKGTVVVIRNVPAKVCSNCGNYYLSSKISRLFKRMRVHGLIKAVGKTYKYYLTKLGKEVIFQAQKIKEIVLIPAFNY